MRYNYRQDFHRTRHSLLFKRRQICTASTAARGSGRLIFLRAERDTQSRSESSAAAARGLVSCFLGPKLSEIADKKVLGRTRSDREVQPWRSRFGYR